MCPPLFSPRALGVAAFPAAGPDCEKESPDLVDPGLERGKKTLLRVIYRSACRGGGFRKNATGPADPDFALAAGLAVAIRRFPPHPAPSSDSPPLRRAPPAFS